MPPGLRTMFCRLSGLLHLICVATLNSCISTMMVKNFIQCCCTYCSQHIIVATTVSGCDGVASMNGPNAYLVALPTFPSFLATSFMRPDHSIPCSWLVMDRCSVTSLCISRSSARERPFVCLITSQRGRPSCSRIGGASILVGLCNTRRLQAKRH